MQEEEQIFKEHLKILLAVLLEQAFIVKLKYRNSD